MTAAANSPTLWPIIQAGRTPTVASAAGERVLQREDRRLGELRAVDGILVGLEQQLADRTAQVGRHRVVHRAERGAVDGGGVVQRSRHTRVLRALAGEQPPAGDPAGDARHRAQARLVAGGLAKRGGCLVAVGRADRQPVPPGRLDRGCSTRQS